MRLDGIAVILILAGVGAGSSAIRAHDDHPAGETYCQLFSQVRDNLSANVGSQIDRLTRLAAIDVMCEHKAMVFRQDVALRPRDIDREWISRRTRHWSQTYCDRHRAFASAIRDGWTISTVLTLSDGSNLRIDAACHDADA